ncbi:salicylate esterase [Herbaspirillum rubrisubalbicans]|uniref:Salicylate esterase n=1 Tax=Herbaspirillum rubrisubalbicans TaxID=80842 RepID=A0ABX9BWU2_9BURK|nr:alpha/beta hydrolase [Herbaspirillum rubrisubalbicans]RAM62206.1 salicylate esterase [Herbaspirillum rubrisubalbicans]RAN50039.1 salicylate esterase [Herbaspirillum rubrisubalbicans]
MASDTYVLVHGAWHTGATFEATAHYLREQGHIVHCPTLAGNRPQEDYQNLSLRDCVDSLEQYLQQHDLQQVRLLGHSYGGMLISGVADRVAHRLQRLIYLNAFVPLPGESLADMAPPHYRALFQSLAQANDGAVMLPYPIWRENFINDADATLALQAFQQLHPQPHRCFADGLALRLPTAELPIGKSYINCRQDTALPHSLPWHPRLSERLGLFRYVEAEGSHEVMFTDPAGLAQAVLQAGRD